MTEEEMVAELARRAGLSEADAKNVLAVLAQIAGEQRRPAKSAPPVGASYVPTDREIAELIAAASSHPLGLEFLLEGDVCAVATMFRAHPFTVDAARERIRAEGVSPAGA